MCCGNSIWERTKGGNPNRGLTKKKTGRNGEEVKASFRVVLPSFHLLWMVRGITFLVCSCFFVCFSHHKMFNHHREGGGKAAPLHRKEEKAAARKRGNQHHTNDRRGEFSTTRKERKEKAQRQRRRGLGAAQNGRMGKPGTAQKGGGCRIFLLQNTFRKIKNQISKHKNTHNL